MTCKKLMKSTILFKLKLNGLTNESRNSFFPTFSAVCSPPDPDMSFVSLGFVSSSFLNPGVSVSGGKARVNLTLVPTSSIKIDSAKPRTAHFAAP